MVTRHHTGASAIAGGLLVQNQDVGDLGGSLVIRPLPDDVVVGIEFDQMGALASVTMATPVGDNNVSTTKSIE